MEQAFTWVTPLTHENDPFSSIQSVVMRVKKPAKIRGRVEIASVDGTVWRELFAQDAVRGC